MLVVTLVNPVGIATAIMTVYLSLRWVLKEPVVSQVKQYSSYKRWSGEELLQLICLLGILVLRP